ncbi:aminoglycoside phosphotransferase family protein [Celeribacter arenosi]|uniref:Phosphotransferase n=1 Tax=Celeribacter arenosi TaxID=792649 RepID=A0ABP7JZ41_9RHOB
MGQATLSDTSAQVAPRDAQMAAFLATTPWQGARVEPLAGDASRRRYFRLFEGPSRSAILMDAPASQGEDVRPFVAVADYLGGLGFSAPEILARDVAAGFLVLEDLGNDLFDQVCERAPEQEKTLYSGAVDVLAKLAGAAPMAGLKPYEPVMVDLALSSYRWYGAAISGRDLTAEAAEAKSYFDPLIASLGRGRTTVLRDFHAQNLLWLSERDGVARVGLLDFQDAMTGPAVYDLVSLLTDARRDVPPAVREAGIAQFGAATGVGRLRLNREFAICSVQRNLRILMIFARLSLHFGKPAYVDLIPRVWDHLMRDLKHPDLSDLARVVLRDLPPPTPDNLQILRSKCASVPTLE